MANENGKMSCLISESKITKCQGMSINLQERIIPFSQDIVLVKRKGKVYDLCTTKFDKMYLGVLDLYTNELKYNLDIHILLKIQIEEEIKRRF